MVGLWFFVVDNVDDSDIFFGFVGMLGSISEYFFESDDGFILFIIWF